LPEKTGTLAKRKRLIAKAISALSTA